MRTLLASSVLLLATGCTNEDIWLIQVPFVPEPSCEETITHNFTGATVPQTTPGDWTEETYTEQSDALYFAQISILDKSNAVMVLGGEVWPGTKDGDTLSFAWEGEQDDRYSNEHDAGYRFTKQDYFMVSESLTMTISGKSADGEWETVGTADTTWTESDTWDGEVGLFAGEIPAGLYLEDQDGFAQANLADDSDCQASPCQLRVQETCSESVEFTAALTGFTAEDAYDQLEGASQPHGAN